MAVVLVLEEDVCHKSSLTALEICKQEIGAVTARLASQDAEKISKEMEQSKLDLENFFM